MSRKGDHIACQQGFASPQPLNLSTLQTKAQENPDFCAPGTSGCFPYNPVAGSGTFGNGPVGPEIKIFHAKGGASKINVFSL